MQPIRPREAASHPREVTAFDFALHRVAGALGTRRLAPLLGVRPGYLNRMTNVWDDGAHFRARDLVPTLRLALAELPAAVAVAPLVELARAVDHAVYPLPAAPGARSVVCTLGRCAHAFGDLGHSSLAAIDPAGEGGPRVTPTELERIEHSGFGLVSHVAQLLRTTRALRIQPKRR